MAPHPGLAAFAAAAGVELVPPPPGEPDGDFRDDPRLDHGRVVRRTPLGVLRPRDTGQLVACVGFLGEAKLRYTTRGAAHSAGGQTLVQDGVVLDLRHLDRILDDDPSNETLTIEGGAWWLALVRHLGAQGRRPRALTGNLRSSVAGTLAVGGFGDSSHLSGLQITHVLGMTLVTPDGARHRLGPDDELFRYSLAGRGQLGIIAEVTLRTVRRPLTIACRRLRWDSLGAFVRDSALIGACGTWDFLRARLRLPGGEVVAHAGRGLVDGRIDEPGRDLLAPSESGELERLDLLEALGGDLDHRQSACPALELVLPLPDGLAAWPELAAMITSAGIPALQPLGHSVMVVPAAPRFPLAPTPPAGRGLLVALRPELPIAEAPALLPALRAIGRRALELGARLYLMSIDLEDPRFAERQFGAALPRLRALRAERDPHGLLNAGLLEGPESPA